MKKTMMNCFVCVFAIQFLLSVNKNFALSTQQEKYSTQQEEYSPHFLHVLEGAPIVRALPNKMRYLENGEQLKATDFQINTDERSSLNIVFDNGQVLHIEPLTYISFKDTKKTELVLHSGTIRFSDTRELAESKSKGIKSKPVIQKVISGNNNVLNIRPSLSQEISYSEKSGVSFRELSRREDAQLLQMYSAKKRYFFSRPNDPNTKIRKTKSNLSIDRIAVRTSSLKKNYLQKKANISRDRKLAKQEMNYWKTKAAKINTKKDLVKLTIKNVNAQILKERKYLEVVRAKLPNVSTEKPYLQEIASTKERIKILKDGKYKLNQKRIDIKLERQRALQSQRRFADKKRGYSNSVKGKRRGLIISEKRRKRVQRRQARIERKRARIERKKLKK